MIQRRRFHDDKSGDFLDFFIEPGQTLRPRARQNLALFQQDIRVDVQRRHQRVGRAGAFDHLQLVLQYMAVHAVCADIEHRALRPRCQRLMDAVDDQIRTQILRRPREAVDAVCIKKFQMRTVRLIDDQKLAAVVRDLCDRPNVAADAVIIRRWQDHCLCLRIFIQTARDLVRGDAAQHAVSL